MVSTTMVAEVVAMISTTEMVEEKILKALAVELLKAVERQQEVVVMELKVEG